MASLISEKERMAQDLGLGAISVINLNPIDVIERLGKYEFIYDYDAVPQPIIYNFAQKIDLQNQGLIGNQLENNKVASPLVVKQPSFNSDTIAPIWQGIPAKSEQYVANTINQNSQVGVFSKGNVVNVIRFEGSNAIIENPNYILPDTNTVKPTWLSSWFNVNVVNIKEFSIPKEYLSKIDDSTPVTISTGINYGANIKPQPVYNIPPVKTSPFSPLTQTILEENASFVLAKDFQYVSGYTSRDCTKNSMCAENASTPQFLTLKAGTNVTGQLFRAIDNTAYKVQAGAILPPAYNDYLAVKGYGTQGSINIPVEYLTKELPTNSGSVVPEKNDNKNLLMIVGAFLVGYVLFNKGKSE